MGDNSEVSVFFRDLRDDEIDEIRNGPSWLVATPKNATLAKRIWNQSGLGSPFMTTFQLPSFDSIKIPDFEQTLDTIIEHHPHSMLLTIRGISKIDGDISVIMAMRSWKHEFESIDHLKVMPKE